MRIDVFLDSVCIYKSRTMSAKACTEGLVKINGNNIKPSREVKENDIIEIDRFSVSEKYRIVSIPKKNVKKSDVNLYLEKIGDNL